ncbi:hypothetical protein [Agromyces rhizosphaerae]|nr:hypothetical protein [Agromyces rhizosphaerae]
MTSTLLRTQESMLRELDSRVEFAMRPDLASLVHWKQNNTAPVHRWYRYREGFSPKLIDVLGLGDRILDPFAGSGSVMVGAAERGLSSAGIDVNPLATFVAGVKLAPLSREQIAMVGAHIELIQSGRFATEEWPIPALNIAHKLFEPTIMTAMMQLRRTIEDHVDDDAVHRYLLLAWISSLESVGSYFKEGNGIKYRNMKRAPISYVRRPEGEWQRARFGDDQRAFAVQTYTRRLQDMLEDEGRIDRGAWSPQRIETGNAAEVLPNLHGEMDSILFSPPYANRFDYFEALKVELWFGGFVSTYEELRKLRKSSMRSHLASDLTQPSASLEELSGLIALMDESSYAMRTRVPGLLAGYFDDMRKVLEQCRRLLARGGRVFVVVGNSAYAGVIVPSDALIAEIGRRVGFSNVRVSVVRPLAVAPQQRLRLDGLSQYMRESVVELW